MVLYNEENMGDGKALTELNLHEVANKLAHSIAQSPIGGFFAKFLPGGDKSEDPGFNHNNRGTSVSYTPSQTPMIAQPVAQRGVDTPSITAGLDTKTLAFLDSFKSPEGKINFSAVNKVEKIAAKEQDNVANVSVAENVKAMTTPNLTFGQRQIASI